jgi:hypothetical protein
VTSGLREGSFKTAVAAIWVRSEVGLTLVVVLETEQKGRCGKQSMEGVGREEKGSG